MSTTITVEGMTCGHCEQTIEEAVEEVSGVTGAAADLDIDTLLPEIRFGIVDGGGFTTMRIQRVGELSKRPRLGVAKRRDARLQVSGRHPAVVLLDELNTVGGGYGCHMCSYAPVGLSVREVVSLWETVSWG